MNKNQELQIQQIISEKDMSKVDMLIKRYHPLIVSSVRKCYGHDYEFEELYDQGVLEVCEALKEYDCKINNSFGGYLKSRLYYFYLTKGKKKEPLSLDMPVGEDNLCLMDLLEDDLNIERDFLKTEQHKELFDALNTLTSRQLTVVLDFYFKRKSIEEISNKMNIKYRTVVNTKTRALEKLKIFLIKDSK
ncbi:MAG: sigma-70 family RNA polymerase sigma factor [Lagierella massiliensis]|nr:sigma-70 family RNA polymerase sigma factor [Lagierella massiliensis]